MISRREKLQLFNKLRGAGHAEADLALLEDVNPRHPKLTRFARDPKRMQTKYSTLFWMSAMKGIS